MSVSKLLLIHIHRVCVCFFLLSNAMNCCVASVSACNFHCVNKLETWTLFFSFSHFYFYQSSHRRKKHTHTVFIRCYDEDDERSEKNVQFTKPRTLCACARVSWSTDDRAKKRRNDRKGTYLTWTEKMKRRNEKNTLFCARSLQMHEWKSATNDGFDATRILAWNIFPLFNRLTQPSHTSVERTSHCFPLNLHRSTATAAAASPLNRTKLKCIELI